MVEPLMKQENELKKMAFSVLVGVQINKHVWLRNGARNGPKRGKSGLTFEGLTLVASWLEFVAP